MTTFTDRQRQGFIICRVCSARVGEANYRRHLRKIHSQTMENPHPTQRSLDDLLDAKGNLIRPAPLEEPKYLVSCLQCSNKVRSSRLKQHYLKVHGIADPPPPAAPQALPFVEWPIGLKVLDGLNKGIRWSATGTESCSSCGARIIHLEMENKKFKAFEVDRDRNIQGTHACDATPRSDSVYAVSGGIVDSNRRKH